MNKPITNTISDSVQGLQLEEINAKAKESLIELKQLNDSIDESCAEFLDDNFDPQVNKRDIHEVDGEDDKDIEALSDKFGEKAGKIFEEEIGE